MASRPKIQKKLAVQAKHGGAIAANTQEPEWIRHEISPNVAEAIVEALLAGQKAVDQAQATARGLALGEAIRLLPPEQRESWRLSADRRALLVAKNEPESK